MGRVADWVWRSMCVFAGVLCAGCSQGALDESDVDESLGKEQHNLLADGSLAWVGEHGTTTTYSLVSATALTSARFVTAGKLGSSSAGRIGVVLWRLEDDGTITHLDSFTAPGDVSTKIAVARVDDHRFVVAGRSSAGNYYLAAFGIDPSTFVISQTDEEVRGGIADIAITAMNPVPGDLDIPGPSGAAREGHVVVAHRASNDALGLTDYSLDANGALTRNGSASAGAVQSVAIATVPGGHPPASILSRSGACDPPAAAWCSAERSACSDNTDNDGDDFVDCNDWDCCGSAACANSGACVQGIVVTATTSSTDTMKLVAWRIGAAGEITRLGDVGAGSATSFDISAQSFRRVATVRTSGGNPVFTSWDIDPSSGAITEFANYSAGRAAADVRLINGSGARLFWLFSDSSDAGFLQTMEGIDTPRALERIRLADTFWPKSGDIVSLSNDRVILANSDADNKLRLRAYRDYNQPLIKSSTGALGGSAPGTDPGFGFTIQGPFSGPQDNQIAVGTNFVLACGNSIAIYDKAGALLKGPIRPSTLYGSLLPTLNAHLPYQFACDATLPGSSDRTNQCLEEWFDGRCAYDSTTGRFVLSSTMRWRKNGSSKDRSQRLMAIAVSRTNDPRDGFETYATTDNKYDDNPVLAAANGTAILAFQWTDNDLADTIPDESLRPSVLLFDIASMSAGSTGGVAGKLAQWQTGGRRQLRVAGSGGLFQLGVVYWDTSAGVDLYAFRNYVRGEVPVFGASVSLPTSGEVIHNGFINMSKFNAANPASYDGHLYVPQVFTGSTGSRGIHIHDISVRATVVGSAITGIAASSAGSKDIPFCGGPADSSSCILPAIVATSDRVITLYGQYTFGLTSCSNCASGFCSPAGSCAASPLYPSIRAQRWSVPISSALFRSPFNFITGPAPDLSGDGWVTDASVLDRSAAVLDTDGVDVFGIHATTDDACPAATSCTSYDDIIVRYNVAP